VSSGKRSILPADPEVVGELDQGTPANELQMKGDGENIDSRLRGNDE
jgi:hypothetical protein